MKEPFQQYINWPDVYHLCNFIADNVIKPDLIIGIASGGLIPTSIIARRLNVFNIQYIGLKSYTDQKTQKTIEMYHKPTLNPPLSGKILVIDDLLDSGNSFNYVCDYLGSLGVSYSDIQCAAMHYKIKSKQYKPYNFIYGTKCDGDTWLAYPWE